MRIYKTRLIRPLAAILALSVSLGCTGSQAVAPRVPEDATPQDAQDLGARMNRFGMNLYGELAKEEGNLFFSPFSISTALAMTYAGASGQTAQEMASVLHLSDDPEGNHRRYAALLGGLLASGKPYELHTANALWPQKDYAFLPEYIETTERYYGAGVTPLDYKSDAERARKTINVWVEKQTRDKIQDLIKPGVVDALTRLVLTNAIYFKGDWVTEFPKDATRDEPFYTGGGGQVAAPLMNLKKSVPYMENDSLQAVALPYKGNELEMLVVLPKERNGLPAVEKGLTGEAVMDITAAMSPAEVRVTLPKFKATLTFSLNDVLMALGMRRAFGGQADFSGMTGAKDLFISDVIHKAFVDVNEEGTEAAAATAVVMKRTAVAPSEPKVFRADHPFVYAIRDRRSGTLLFLGRLDDPAA